MLYVPNAEEQIKTGGTYKHVIIRDDWSVDASSKVFCENYLFTFRVSDMRNSIKPA